VCFKVTMSDDEEWDCEYIYEEEDEDDMGYTDKDNDGYDTADEKDGTSGVVSGEKGDLKSGSAEKNRRKSSGAMDVESPDFSMPDEGHYRIVELSDVRGVMDAQVAEMSELLSIDRDSSLVLMQHFRWAKEKMIEQYYSDPEKAMFDAELQVPAHVAEAKSSSSGDAGDSKGDKDSKDSKDSKDDKVQEDKIECPICLDDPLKSEAFALSCGHYFCRRCYGMFLNSQVGSGPECLNAWCPGVNDVKDKGGSEKCKLRIPQSAMKEFLTPENAVKYESYVLNAFVDSHPKLRFCPSPGCEKIAIGSAVTHVDCHCSQPFCFRCGEEVHDPSSCGQLGEWKEKCNNESETANWIIANTKKCPKCQARIEKNQGCNHMKCKNCSFDFCWQCMEEWSKHNSETGGYYNCNRFVSAEKQDMKNAKAELDRYLFYYQRYHNHGQSLKFATTHMRNTEKRMQEMQDAGHDWSEVQYLKVAMQQIIACRRVLKYTYVLGFFLKDSTEKEKACKQLFEYHQEMLEKNTEDLHGKAERPWKHRIAVMW
jgi:ariadne-1